MPTCWPISYVPQLKRTEILAMLQDLARPDANPPVEVSPPPPTDPAANTAAHTDVQIKMLRIL